MQKTYSFENIQYLSMKSDHLEDSLDIRIYNNSLNNGLQICQAYVRTALGYRFSGCDEQLLSNLTTSIVDSCITNLLLNHVCHYYFSVVSFQAKHSCLCFSTYWNDEQNKKH